MRFFISLSLVLLSILGFSQTKEIKVSKAKIAESKSLNDLISELPKDCRVIRYVFFINMGDALKEFTCEGEGIPKELKSIISTKEKGKSFSIENIKTDCPKSHSFNYKIILE